MCVENSSLEDKYQLKPCPFCAGTPIFVWNKHRHKEVWFLKVKCTVCGAYGKVFCTYHDPTDEFVKVISWVADAWNTRHYFDID